MLVTNYKESHKKILIDNLNEADRIFFAVGFLKRKGFDNIKSQLEELCNDRSRQATFYIGTGYGETDPKALLGLYNIIKKNPNNRLIICNPDAGIFHPKLYMFVKNNAAKVFVGSSNLTEGGWFVNDELSIMHETTLESKEYSEFIAYFSRLDENYYNDDVLSVIEKYKSQLEDFKNKNPKRPPFKFKSKSSTIAGIDMPRLKGYYKCYKKSDEFVTPSYRELQYSQAKANLEKIIQNPNLNKQEFHDLFGPLVGHKGYIKLWHSGSLHRKSYPVLDHIDIFQDLVKVIKESLNDSLAVAFTNAKSFLNTKRKAKKMAGVGVNILTEIFMSYSPDKFANLNDNPTAVLSYIGVDFKEPESFTGNDYENYVSLLAKIKEELSIDSFLEIDSFFNYVYWNFLEE